MSVDSREGDGKRKRVRPSGGGRRTEERKSHKNLRVKKPEPTGWRSTEQCPISFEKTCDVPYCKSINGLLEGTGGQKPILSDAKVGDSTRRRGGVAGGWVGAGDWWVWKALEIVFPSTTVRFCCMGDVSMEVGAIAELHKEDSY